VINIKAQIRIVIVEDHALFREGLHLIIKGEEGIEIVGEATNGFQAIEKIRDLQPDVALLDISVPEMDGIEVIPPIRKVSPKTKSLITATDENTILRALSAGARGYLSKDTSGPNLIKAIRAVHEGELWVERKIINRFFDSETTTITDNLRLDNSEKGINKPITKREQQILQLLTKGLTNKEIARALFISHKTVRTHLNSIFRKLNVCRRFDARLHAIKYGLC
jgi:DNA-binding NarL/FixJ family response regulator